MLKGFMDHWVPTTQNISKFWKLDYGTAAGILDQLKSDIDFNNFTFYTKWYTNGVKSDLPYLHNHPEASNVRTDNEWGRSIVDHLHESGVTVGSMIQFLTYEQNVWEPELTIDQWDVRHVAETELPISIADFTDPRFQARVKQIVKEQLTLFPGLDYLFLEFEGLSPAACRKLYDKWAGERGYPDSEQVQYHPDKVTRFERLGLRQQGKFLWAEEVQAMLKHYYELNLRAVKEAVDEIGFQGKVGVVYYVCGYETFIYPDILPDRSWLLVPWVYWTRNGTPVIEEQKEVAKELMRQWKNEGFSLCYIGDVTIEGNSSDIREFYNFCVDLGMEGYLGMGNPVPEVGLKWVSITDEYVLEARQLYKELYGTIKSGT